jgi:diguanylate cyclase (GGDEF)-like protein
MFLAALGKLSGYSSLSDDELLNDAWAARLREERLASVRNHTPGIMLANVYNASVFVFALWETPQFPFAMFWATCIYVMAGNVYFRRRAGSRSMAGRSRSTGRALFNALALGCCWAALPLFFFQGAAPGTQLLIACLSAGMLCGGAFALASMPAAAVAFAGPIAVASFTTLIRSGDASHLLSAELLAVYALVLFRAVCAYAEQLKTRVLSQLEAEQRARRDMLTTLPNRLGFQEALEMELERIARAGGAFLLIYVDLDGFKLINDQLGHLAGDELLRQIAHRMQAALRPFDVLARVGGDEFIVLAPGIGAPTEAMAVARRILECFEDWFTLDGVEVRCVASLGLALAPFDGNGHHELLRNADIALYRAKERGGTFSFFRPQHDAAENAA